ncbi:MAG: UDP-glucose 4-epimerase [uncultured Chloroflexi bacterium]|uniref:UDP-glucose 4-epimerase n=1 Tax=uncultured Chloroflexota bacterium TaxID=166587 RepID=A0A6J4KKX9_9CHLR|nr:MAG: UDP-glucose 4-epimerase [uncultured Chloroflexota bacterium]
MKILVTGGAGNIGAHVCEELGKHGHHVVSFDRQRGGEGRGHRVAGVTYRIGDHEDLGQFCEVASGMDAIAHLSAIPAPRTYPNATVFRTNVMGAFNTHEAAVIAGVPYVVSTSSGSAFGFAWWHRPFYPKYLPMDEDHPDLAQDAYGLSKMVGETIAHGFNRRCDLRVCVIRPPWVVQPDQYETAVRTRLTAQPQDWAGSLYCYVDVRDLATAFRLALEAPPETVQDEVFNVLADDALATEPLSQLLPRLDPAFADLAAGLTGTQPMVSAERIQRVLGWRPQHSWRQYLRL